MSKKYESEIREALTKTKTVDHLLVRDESYEDWLDGFAVVDPAICIGPDDWYIIRHTGVNNSANLRVLLIVTKHGFMREEIGSTISLQ